MDQSARQKWFDGIWAQREEQLYPAFFGRTGPGIYPIPAATFKSILPADPDPRFLTHGVFECPPTPADEPAVGESGQAGHRDWIYVSSGMSNPWGESPETANPAGYSGLGYELTLHTRSQARWAVLLLHWVMAVQLLAATGQIKGELLQRNDRIPLGGSVARKGGLITHLLVTSPEERGLSAEGIGAGYPAEFTLPSGRVEMLLLLGITEKEADFARSQGVEGLITLLVHRGVYPLTDPDRPSVV